MAMRLPGIFWQLSILLLAPGVLFAARLEEVNPWPKFTDPAPGDPEVIGNYDAGCVRGAQRLPLDDEAFQIMRPKRRRFFAHPDLVRFIEGLAAQTTGYGLGPILIGDLGQARGGPSASSHASHQVGLDVDIWYWRPVQGQRLSRQERNSLSAPKMVVPDFEKLTTRWRPQMAELLRTAAQQDRVDRIFVNPIIKQEVCRKFQGEPWVRFLRPWWGHDDHFHVRLMCPERSPLCKPTEDPIPEGDGCGSDLAAWLTPERRAKAKYMRTHPQPSPMPVLPDACRQLLNP